MVSGVHPDYSIPLEAPRYRLGKRVRDIPLSTNFLNEIDSSAKKRWKDPACNYKPQNLRDRFQVELDEWIQPE